MHSRLQVLVEFQTTTGPLPVFVPCCCLDELESYRSRSPKYDGPPRSLVTLIIRTSECDDRSARRHRGVRGHTGGCDGRYKAEGRRQKAEGRGRKGEGRRQKWLRQAARSCVSAEHFCLLPSAFCPSTTRRLR